MRATLLLFSAAVLFSAGFAPAGGKDVVDKGEKKEPEPALVREIDLKGVTFTRESGSAKAPIVIESAADIKKHLEGAKELADKISKVDFTKEYALIFAWSGSGGDKIALGSATKDKAIFIYTPGLTRDLRQHLSAFAVAKGTPWAVETGKLKIKIKPIKPIEIKPIEIKPIKIKPIEKN